MHEDVLDYEQFELLERLLGVVEVRFTEKRIFAGDVHGLDAAIVDLFHHVGDHEARFGGQWLAAPGFLELGKGGFSDCLIAGEGVRVGNRRRRIPVRCSGL